MAAIGLRYGPVLSRLHSRPHRRGSILAETGEATHTGAMHAHNVRRRNRKARANCIRSDTEERRVRGGSSTADKADSAAGKVKSAVRPRFCTFFRVFALVYSTPFCENFCVNYTAYIGYIYAARLSVMGVAGQLQHS